LLAYERAALKTAGFACDIVSGGGTGTLALSTDAGALNEIQAGSYVLMDASYERLGLPFETALGCRATVISRQGSRMVLDAGLKALSAEYHQRARRRMISSICKTRASLPGSAAQATPTVARIPASVRVRWFALRVRTHLIAAPV
jgi:D-serine deaminase-like pyridoxal phosphate-dependent protein